MSQEIWKALKEDCASGPFSNLKFVKRGDKYYVTCVVKYPQYKFNEEARESFHAWIKTICDKYGWAPYMTSGSPYDFTYRLNGDPEISRYAYL